MIRTHIQLTEEQARMLKRVSAARGVSIAELIREAVDRHLAGRDAVSARQRAVASVGGFRSGYYEVSIDHDRHVAAAFAE